jgi:uncharacterized membrane protein
MATESAGLGSGNGAFLKSHGFEESEAYTPGKSLRSRVSRMRDPFARVTDEQLAEGLAWFSVALGVTALLAPRSLGKLTGLGPKAGLVRFVGARELASGVGLLSSRDATPWLWSRVAGDAMDLLTLGASALKPAGGGRLRSLVSLALVAGVTAADVSASIRHSSRSKGSQSRRLSAEDYLERSVSINRSPQECYDYWRNFGHAPHFMKLIGSVTTIDEKTSHWVAELPGGRRVEWDARLTDDVPGKRIAWHSVHAAPLVHAGVVTFESAPGNRGTIVRVVMHYRPPAVPAAMRAARALRFAPEFEIQEDLRRFKNILETGEIPTTRSQPAGKRSLLARMFHTGRGA